ncbi:Hsp20/alpha crystallin family protein [Halobacillus salinus]|uniref:Hsp20/alpha crystallin family protein n=1 Tax=Halobacillus salinus TaxID=192814 RepID=UPI0009A7F4D7|nr:Hsp20/alpha crystallin family protein [Halobacillus salinus]
MNKKTLNWDAFNKNVENVLGESFWNDIQQVLPKRSPCYDLFDLGREALIMVDLPGFTKQDRLELAQEDHHLLIEGEVHLPQPEWEDKLVHSERLTGPFKRSIPIPFAFEYEDINASFRNGVLWISIQKKASTKEVSIDPAP